MARCQIFVGEIVSHPCGARGVVRCDKCSRVICKAHLHQRKPAVCVQCAGVYTPPEAFSTVTEEELYHFTSEEFAIFDTPDQNNSALLHYLDS